MRQNLLMQKIIKIIKKNWDFNHLLVHDHSKVHQFSWNPVLVIFLCGFNSHRSIMSLLEWLTTKLVYHFSRRLQMQDFKAHNKRCFLVKNSMGCPFHVTTTEYSTSSRNFGFIFVFLSLVMQECNVTSHNWCYTMKKN